MTLTQLRYLVAIADSGLNITQAAERVHATQPGLSKQLKQLEDELGFQLFSRKGRSLESIAPAGVRVIEHARKVLAEVANIRSYAANERGEHSGRLLLATTHTQARYVLPPAIAAIKREFPQVSVDLLASGDSDVLEKLDQEYGSICSKKDYLDGLSFEFEDYRFNVRISNTEPLLRLNVETKGNHDLLKSKLDSIDSLIVSYNAK